MRKSNAALAGRASPVDLVHLARQTFGDTELEREVLRLFVTQSRLCLDRMKAAANQRQWFEAAHTIKGSARGIGAWDVAAAAEAAEAAHFRHGSGKANELAAMVESRLSEANDWIDGLLAA